MSLNNFKFDKIYHLACLAKPGTYSITHPGDQWIANQQINTNILNWWSKYQSKAKLISIGTSLSYPENNSLIEKNYLLGNPSSQAYEYAMTKRMLQIGVEGLNKQYNLKYLTLVSSAIFGPEYYVGRKEQHFIFDLIKKILDYKYQKKEIVLWGDGYQSRDLFYIKDFVNELIELDNLCENQIINLGYGKGMTIRNYAKIICKYLDVDHSVIKYDSKVNSGQKKKIMNINKLKKIINNRNLTSINDGISETINWMKSQYYKNK